MIVPRSRLLAWLAWTGMPLAIVHATVPEAAWLFWLVVLGFLLVALFDAVKAGNALAGIAVSTPPLLRLQKGMDGDFPVEFLHEQGSPQGLGLALRLGIVFPAQIGAVLEEIDVMLPAEAKKSRISLRCHPVERGNFRVEIGALQTDSPLGFWAIRRKISLASEIRVYPDMTKERKTTAMLLARGRFGLRAQRHAGKGRDFEKIRDYLPGDSIQDIHWKASAKRRQPVTKIFQIERTQEVVVVLDASRLSRVRGPDGNTLLERFVTSALVLCLAARQQGDHFGLVAFSDRVLRFVRPGSGKNHYQICRDLLYNLEPSPVAPDFQEIATTLRLKLRKRALVVFLTSLGDAATAEAFRKSVPPLCRKHLLVVNMVRPPGVAPLFKTPAQSVEQIYDQLGGHLLWRELRELQKELEREGVRLSLFDHERLAAELVTQYMQIKGRQIL